MDIVYFAHLLERLCGKKTNVVELSITDNETYTLNKWLASGFIDNLPHPRKFSLNVNNEKKGNSETILCEKEDPFTILSNVDIEKELNKWL